MLTSKSYWQSQAQVKDKDRVQQVYGWCLSSLHHNGAQSQAINSIWLLCCQMLWGRDKKRLQHIRRQGVQDAFQAGWDSAGVSEPEGHWRGTWKGKQDWGGRSGNIEGVSGSSEVMLRPHRHWSLSTSGDFSGWLHAPPSRGLGSRSTPDNVIHLGLGSCLQQAGLR